MHIFLNKNRPLVRVQCVSLDSPIFAIYPEMKLWEAKDPHCPCSPHFSCPRAPEKKSVCILFAITMNNLKMHRICTFHLSRGSNLLSF